MTVSEDIKVQHQRMLKYHYNRGMANGLELAILILDGVIDPQLIAELNIELDNITADLYG